MLDQDDRQPCRDGGFPLRAGVIALVVGVLLATSVGVVWARAASAPAVTLLGSGDGLSVLVTTPHARLLLVGGNDPAAFANALADARPRTAPRVDLVVELPGARAVAARANALARPTATLTLDPARRFPDQPAATPITGAVAIDLPGGVTVTLDPGSAEGDWSVTIAMPGATVLVLPAWGLAAARADVALVVLAGESADGAEDATRAPAIAASALAFPDDLSWPTAGPLVGSIPVGEAVRLPLAAEGGLAVPAGWRPQPAP
jgi:hypothetical protein